MLAQGITESEAQAAQAQGTGEAVWKPQHRKDCDGNNCRCAQVLAYNSEADEIGFGGEGGGGKSELLLGLAGTKQRRTLIFRREFPRLEGIEARSREIFNASEDARLKDSYNESLHRWELNSDGVHRVVRLAAMQYEDDKLNFQGRPYDGVFFDEAPEFTETQVRFVTGWNRSTVPGQKCRTVLTFNPPMNKEQEWIIPFFAPWLDEKYPDPAKDGELRYVARFDDRDNFYRTLEEIPEEIKDQLKKLAEESGIDSWEKLVKTRTLFHAKLSDNPILAATGYAGQVNNLPEPLRSILQGKFNVNQAENPWQVIPTAWVKAAIERGKQRERRTEKQTALGNDVARGGKDKFVIAPLNGLWFEPLLKYPGISVQSGQAGAALIIAARRDDSVVGIDIVGIGSSVYDKAVELGIKAISFSGGSKSDMTDKTEKLTFANVVSAAYWCLREALDPENDSGICFPDDPELLGDLTAARFTVVGGRIKVESKDDYQEQGQEGKTKGIKARLGRSPDCGDAVIIAWWTFLVSLALGMQTERVGYAPVRIGGY